MSMMCEEALIDICNSYFLSETRRMRADDSYLVGLLPDRRPYRYTAAFVHDFAVCVLTVAWKLAEPTNVFPLASVAERLALDIIIREAEAILEDERCDGVLIQDVPLDLRIDFLPFHRAVFGDDTEFRRLYLQTPSALRSCRNLEFGEWFKPFAPGDYVHGFTTAGWPPQKPDHGWFAGRCPRIEAGYENGDDAHDGRRDTERPRTMLMADHPAKAHRARGCRQPDERASSSLAEERRQPDELPQAEEAS